VFRACANLFGISWLKKVESLVVTFGVRNGHNQLEHPLEPSILFEAPNSAHC